MLRTHEIKKVNENLVGSEVTLSGWISSIREHGKVLFIDLRDISGSIQTVITSKSEDFEIAKKLTKESCIQIIGEVKKRPEGTENKEMQTGMVELKIGKLNVLNNCLPLPFDLDNEETNEEIRLRYRYLDLRRKKMQRNLVTRSKVMQVIRNFLDKKEFNEIETPILAKSTPEGARDYIVPSRTQSGKFFALPQSPQLFKQLLMVAGMDKYYQIARCMRDEDLRSDRQPEFTQLDIEMSFINEEDIIKLTEQLLKEIWEKILNIEIETPFPRITYEQSMKKYNTDRPDLRKDKNNPNEFAFCWVTDFPAFEYSKEHERYTATHHPFTMPNIDEFNKNPETSKSQAYDIVVNGVEIGGGSIRIHNPEIQKKVFSFLKISEKEQEDKFGFLINALKFGAPPHGGIAWGLDRLMQLLLSLESIREAIAFPKNKEARDLMLDSPSTLTDKQLKDVHIKLDIKKGKSLNTL